MSVKCGMVGLPNVGKSTLFNILTNNNVASENFPFCTIKPNIGVVSIPDIRLNKIADIVCSKKIIQTFIQFIDIAGLIQGSYKGEGLGNQFLSNIQHTDAVMHIVRAFKDSNITHIYGKIEPISDIEIINIELILSDLKTCESRILIIDKNLKNISCKKEKIVLQHCITCLKKFIMLRVLDWDKDEILLIHHLRLLTLKPTMYVINTNDISDNESFLDPVYELAQKENSEVIKLCAKSETHKLQLKDKTKKHSSILTSINQKKLDQIATSSYSLLNLHTFFTAGIQEVKAWTILKGTTALEAAGKIHTDFKKGFIRAQTISYTDFIKYKGEKNSKEHGKYRKEGKSYIVQDGDIINFLFNI